MKKDRYKIFFNGFTLIEVLISIVIVSLILLISTNILESSISSRTQTLNVLDNMKQFNIVSNTLRRDFRQVINVPMKDTFGLSMNATFYAADQSDQIIFTTMVNHSNMLTTKLRRVEYLLRDKSLIRRQYYAVNPYLTEDFFESELVQGIENITFRFSDGKKWFSEWPKDEITRRMIPQLIEIKLESEEQYLEWFIAPRINHAYQY